MKTILSFTCLIALLATSGCIVAEGGRRHRHSEVIVGPPVILVPVPVVVHPL
jgi:hypothetical protein